MSILVVDQDSAVTRVLRIALQAEGYEVVTATSESAALAAIPTVWPEVIVLGVSTDDDKTRGFIHKARRAGYFRSIVALSRDLERMASLDPDDVLRLVKDAAHCQPRQETSAGKAVQPLPFHFSGAPARL